MGKRKPPAPRGYDPGGFRFPGATPFFNPTERFDERHSEQAKVVLVEVEARHTNSLAAAGVMFAAALARGLRGRRG